MRILDVLKSSAEYLERSGIDEPLAEAEALIFSAAGVDRLHAFVDNPLVDEVLSERIDQLLKRRASGEPSQYIIGHLDFLGLTIQVGRGVLIPRPETELLVQEAVKELRTRGRAGQKDFPRVVDLCTGSGCIALALAHEFSGGDIFATDTSEEALQFARKNALTNTVGNVAFLRGSLFEPVRHVLDFDLIISNPPYIRTSDIAGLQREIREWEPLDALDGGRDGLDFYRRILSGAGRYLAPTGAIMFELGFDQAAEVANLAKEAGFTAVTVIKDFAGIGRIMKAGR